MTVLLASVNLFGSNFSSKHDLPWIAMWEGWWQINTSCIIALSAEILMEVFLKKKPCYDKKNFMEDLTLCPRLYPTGVYCKHSVNFSIAIWMWMQWKEAINYIPSMTKLCNRNTEEMLVCYNKSAALRKDIWPASKTYLSRCILITDHRVWGIPNSPNGLATVADPKIYHCGLKVNPSHPEMSCLSGGRKWGISTTSSNRILLGHTSDGQLSESRLEAAVEVGEWACPPIPTAATTVFDHISLSPMLWLIQWDVIRGGGRNWGVAITSNHILLGHFSYGWSSRMWLEVVGLASNGSGGMGIASDCHSLCQPLIMSSLVMHHVYSPYVRSWAEQLLKRDQ